MNLYGFDGFRFDPGILDIQTMSELAEELKRATQMSISYEKAGKWRLAESDLLAHQYKATEWLIMAFQR